MLIIFFMIIAAFWEVLFQKIDFGYTYVVMYVRESIFVSVVLFLITGHAEGKGNVKLYHKRSIKIRKKCVINKTYWNKMLKFLKHQEFGEGIC